MDVIITFFVEVWNNVVKYAQTIGISDIVDVAIIAFLCYKLLKLMTRTNTARVFKVLVIFVVAAGAASVFKLNVINFLLSKIVELGFLALIVVFQPELRRFLEQVGSSSITSIFRLSQTEDTMEEAIRQTVIAAEELANRHEGALIIFERKISLDDVLKTGTVIGAETSGELLRNIFYPKAPLHDGAVVIRKGKIAGAGCMLPLSGNVNLSRDLGMRHRAGIGVSEHTDAVAVIISEETGAISVAVGGMLKRRLTADTLERLLYSELVTAEDMGTVKRNVTFGSIFKGKKNGKEK